MNNLNIQKLNEIIKHLNDLKKEAVLKEDYSTGLIIYI